MPVTEMQVVVTNRPQRANSLAGRHEPDDRALVHSPADRKAPYDETVVQAMVEQLLLDAGWDSENIGSANWNPFGHVVRPGDRVLVKPNWVFHYNKSGQGLEALVTHSTLLRSILTYVMKAGPGAVVVGDAPLQGCDLAQLTTGAKIDELQRHFGAAVVWRDFRRTVLLNAGGIWDRLEGLRPESDYVLYDVGSESLLEPISGDAERFRVTLYNPDLMRATHAVGRHQYLITADAINADVVINLPKLKTHMKAGLTGALKNLVGINGNKDYLPHHRKGGTRTGGDCYPGGNRLKLLAESLLDLSNRSSGRKAYLLRRLSAYVHGMARLFRADRNLEGSWHGNDTVWRMCLDLNRILAYGCRDGLLADERQRTVVTITDAIVAGEGEGPLSPLPYHLGALTLALNPAAADLVHAHLMGFDWAKIPIVREAFGDFRYPVAEFAPDDVEVVFNGSVHGRPWPVLSDRPFLASPGWMGHCEAL